MNAPHRAFDTARVILLSIGHGIDDMNPAFLAPLLPLLQTKLHLSNTLAGSLATFLRSSSLAQPFIGYLDNGFDCVWEICDACIAGIALDFIQPGMNRVNRKLLRSQISVHDVAVFFAVG